MKNQLVVGNWKATKTIKETIEWVNLVKNGFDKNKNIKIVICPPFTSLHTFKSLVLDAPYFKIGAQDVSKFKKGAYTGEVTAAMLEGLVDYAIVGHSERRKYFGEGDDDVIRKVENLLEFSITPILCVSDIKQLDSYLERGKKIIEEAEKIIFVYEPPSAISGGGDYRPESPKVANENAKKIIQKIGKDVTLLYGGSINPENISEFFSQEKINGGLVGQASTNPTTFLKLISNI